MCAIVPIDGQNLYHLAWRAWASGSDSPYAWPSYDVGQLVSVLVSRMPDRTLTERRFGYAKVRYRGLCKNTQRLALLLGFANLMRAERYLAV